MLHLIEQASVHHGIHALVDALVQVHSIHREPEIARIIARRGLGKRSLLRGIGYALVAHLERPNDPAHVMLVDHRRALRVAFSEQLMQGVRPVLLLVALIPLPCRRGALTCREAHVIEGGAEVEARAAAEHAGLVPRAVLVDERSRIALEQRRGIRLLRIDEVDKP